jgi:hypothetical protein
MQGNMNIPTYREPTTAATAVNNAYCRPGVHKMATFKNGIHRLHKLPLNETNINKEFNSIVNIPENNGYRKEQTTNSYNRIIHKSKIRQMRQKSRNG